jgi:hypothetical protein
MSTTTNRRPLRLQIPERIAQVRERLTEHTLDELTPPDGKVRSFRMSKPGTRIDSTMITFTPEGIAIQGDLTPGANGVVSRGKSLEWFAGQLGHDYLAEKFLTKEWVEEDAADGMREVAEDIEREATEIEEEKERALFVERAQRFREIADQLDDDGMMFHEFVEDLDELGIQYESEGHAYPPNDVVLLAAIQQRFAELYAQCATTSAQVCGA